MIRFCGHSFTPLPSGALHWTSENTLLVADLHFEKMASFARHGQLLPRYDTGMTLSAIEKDLHLTGAQRVIALGDSFHRDESVAQMLAADHARLQAIMSGMHWTWISGNHDPNPHRIGGYCTTQLHHLGVDFAHEPTHGAKGLMCGHLHPAARLSLNGRTVRRPCFVTDGNIMLLPAYGASTGHLNILSPPFHGLLRRDALQVTMLGMNQTYAVNPKRLVYG